MIFFLPFNSKESTTLLSLYSNKTSRTHQLSNQTVVELRANFAKIKVNNHLHNENYNYDDFKRVRYTLYKNGKLHSFRDLAAVVTANYKQWFRNGKLHRINNPAILGNNGSQEFYYKGRLHSYNDQPAIIKNINWRINYIVNVEVYEWYRKGSLHRDTINSDGDINPAIVRKYHGIEKYEWYTNGNRFYPILSETGVLYTNAYKKNNSSSNRMDWNNYSRKSYV